MGLTFNFDEVLNKLNNIEKKVQNEIAEKALKRAAEPAKKELKRVIDDEAWDTGKLHGSIGISEVKKQGSKSNLYVGSMSTDRETVTKLYYNEYGHDRMAGKDLLKRTAKKTKCDSIDIIIKTVQEELNKT